MVDVDYMVVADAATVAEGKLYIHGAGWDMIGAATFPVVHPQLAVAFLLRVPWNEANLPHRIELDVVNADGQSILPNPPGPMGGTVTVGRPANITPGNDLLTPFVFNLAGITFSQPGDYVVVMRVEGSERKRFPIHLISLAPQAQASISPPS